MVIGIYRVVVAIIRFISFIIFRRRVSGNNTLPKDVPVILCSNHGNILDPVFLALSVDRPVHFMAKKEIFQNPVFNWIFRRIGTFPVNREGVDIRAFKEALKVLKDNKVLGIFPEGTRVKDIRLENFKEGVATLALRTKAIIVPVRIRSTYKLFNRVDVEFRDAINSQDFLNEGDKETQAKLLTQALFQSIYPEEVIHENHHR